MKKVLILLLIPLCFTACTGNSTDGAPATKDSVTAATKDSVTLPYTAAYSSNFVPGKQADVLTVLNNYKAWESGDMAALKATLADTVEMIFPSGTHIKMGVDAAMGEAKKFRDSLSKVQLTLYAWTSNHSVDKNEEWVNVWYKEIDTYKTGKVDSVDYEDDNLLKGGKIAWTSSHSQKLKK
jgi:ketosteroid isomerase-like protein